jgi:NAD(P)-dependent dehydrogenase (short-subunit alcohol dehydrogenase family)
MTNVMNTMRSILVVGSTRGLGHSLVKYYAADPAYTVYGTSRSSSKEPPDKNIEWIPGIDIGIPSAGPKLVEALNGKSLDIVYVTAGFFPTETFDEPKWDDEIKTYTVCAIGPLFIVQSLVKAGLLKKASKIILVSSESGSIALRHESEGGGNYAHHASKTALNMVGKLLSLDLKGKEIAVGMVHPGFMKTAMTADVGFDKFYESGGAVAPDEAAKSLADFAETFEMKMTGTFWAPRGPDGIGTIEDIVGKKNELPTPLQLPW